MVELLKSALKAHSITVLLVLSMASALLVSKHIGASEWRDIVNAVLLYFVGGGLLKEGAVAFAGRAQP